MGPVHVPEWLPGSEHPEDKGSGSSDLGDRNNPHNIDDMYCFQMKENLERMQEGRFLMDRQPYRESSPGRQSVVAIGRARCHQGGIGGSQYSHSYCIQHRLHFLLVMARGNLKLFLGVCSKGSSQNKNQLHPWFAGILLLVCGPRGLLGVSTKAYEDEKILLMPKK